MAARSLPNSRVSAQLTLRHDGSQERSTRVTVRSGSSVLATRSVTLRAGEPVSREWIDFGAGEAGVRDLGLCRGARGG